MNDELMIQSPMAYTGVGRYAFDASLWPAIAEVSASLSAGEELDDIPVMQALLRAGLLTGCLIHGDFLDVGVPAGYEEATQRLTAPSTRVRRSPLRR